MNIPIELCIFTENPLLKLNSDRFKKLISAIQELESIQASKYLDIEFALSNELKPYLFQVRSITTHSSVNLKKSR